jgi:branched-chain amino acid aminotransferase
VSNHEGDNNWALLLDPEGFITEGTGDNFMIVKDGVIISPPGHNILRASVGVCHERTGASVGLAGY